MRCKKSVFILSVLTIIGLCNFAYASEQNEWLDYTQVPDEIWGQITDSMFMKNVQSNYSIALTYNPRDKVEFIFPGGSANSKETLFLFGPERSNIYVNRREIMPCYNAIPNNSYYEPYQTSESRYWSSGGNQFSKMLMNGQLRLQDIIAVNRLSLFIHFPETDEVAILDIENYDHDGAVMYGSAFLTQTSTFAESSSIFNISYNHTVQKELFESNLNLLETRAVYMGNSILLFDGEYEYVLFYKTLVFAPDDWSEIDSSVHSYLPEIYKLYTVQEYYTWIYNITEPDDASDITPQVQDAIDDLPEYKQRAAEFYSTLGELPY